MLLSILVIVVSAALMYILQKRVKIPRLMYYIILGIVLGPFVLDLIDSDLLDLNTYIRAFALIVILIRAGLKLDLKTLKKVGFKVIILSFVPALTEAFFVSVFAYVLLGFDSIQAIMLGLIIASVSPAVIVPHMLQLLKKHPEKTMFSLILSSASIEDAVMIIIFTQFIQTLDLTQTLLILPIYIVTGVIIGMLSGMLISIIMKRIHTRYIPILSVILVSIGYIFLDIISTSNVWISSYVVLFVLGMTLSTIHIEKSTFIEKTLEPMWFIIEIFLFTLLGASLNIHYIQDISLMIIILICMPLLIKLCIVYVINHDMDVKDRIFTALSFSPKATVQAVLAPIPLALGFSMGEEILLIGVIAIMLTAPLASILLTVVSKKLYP